MKKKSERTFETPYSCSNMTQNRQGYTQGVRLRGVSVKRELSVPHADALTDNV